MKDLNKIQKIQEYIKAHSKQSNPKVPSIVTYMAKYDNYLEYLAAEYNSRKNNNLKY